jgi:calcium-translocating P-type ATPase
MRIHRLPADAALAALRTTPEGLTSAEARRRLAEFGPNRLEAVRRTPLWLRGARQFTHFFAIVLWVAAGLALWAAVHDPGSSMGTLALAIVGVIVVNGVFSFWQEHRAEEAVAALNAILPRQATVLRDGVARRLAVEEVVPGDILLVQEGDHVPADCRLLEATALRVNVATITGESLPKARTPAATEEEDPLAARCLLLAGTSVVSGKATAVVFATGMRTEFGRIAQLTRTAGEPPSPLQREIARLSRLVAVAAGVLGLVFFAIGHATGLGLWPSLLFAIGIIVANVPEGLLPTVTLALAMATQRMAKRNALIRRLPAAEALGAATVIVTDKTGTLTENRMTAVRGWFVDGPRDIADIDPRDAPRYAPFFDCARHCHDVRHVVADGHERLLGDPMEVALVEMASARLPARPLTRVDEVPFDADRRRMSTVHASLAGLVLYCKGAVESVLPLCTHTLDPIAGTVPLTGELHDRFLAAQDTMAEQGLRVLALAWRRVPEGTAHARLESGLVLAGLVGLADPPRPEVPDAIARCRSAGIRVIMVTGDHPHTAQAIARAVGLAQVPRVVTGAELARMSDAQLQLTLDRPSDGCNQEAEPLFARVTADQKMRIVDALKRKAEVVAVTGDGVNDAPALKRADIGIAMGMTGTDVAREAADMILLDDNFASIVAAIEEGRAVFQNIRKFLTYILTSNIPELIPYLAFALFRIPLPLTVVQILAVDLGTDLLPALALGAEPPAPDTMRQPPRSRAERLLSWGLLARAYLWLGMLEAAAALAAFFAVLHAGGWRYGEPLAWSSTLYLQATTATLAAIVVMQVVNVFLCRDARRSTFALRTTANPLLAWGIAAEIALLVAIVYTPVGQALFGTAPPPVVAWLVIVPFAAGMLTLEETRKALARIRGSRPRDAYRGSP